MVDQRQWATRGSSIFQAGADVIYNAPLLIGHSELAIIVRLIHVVSV
jgi:hypothetical protein